jgi:hypothetical protein
MNIVVVIVEAAVKYKKRRELNLFLFNIYMYYDIHIATTTSKFIPNNTHT